MFFLIDEFRHTLYIKFVLFKILIEKEKTNHRYEENKSVYRILIFP